MKVRKHKGASFIEIIVVITILSLLTITAVVEITGWYDSSEAKTSGELVAELKKNFDKKELEFEKLDKDSFNGLQEGLVKTNDNKDRFYLNNSKKEIRISKYKDGDNEGFVYAIKNVSVKECNIMGNMLAPKFYNSYVAPNNVDEKMYKSPTNLIKLSPQPDKNNYGLNIVNKQVLTSLCGVDGDKQLIFKTSDSAEFKMKEHTNIGLGSSFDDLEDNEYKQNIIDKMEESKRLNEERIKQNK